ncbi:MAG: hypothetical protein JSW00_18460 [Thermoplasmata archaeon]|nr:MAG: hypothetical protein JSW00_18460 [Thermoplasmata archaeon]
MHGEKRERILRVLLNEPNGTLTKYRVAKLSETSTSWTIEYLQTLQKRRLVKETKVVKIESLLDIWESISRKPLHYDFFMDSPSKFLKKIDMDYALTTYFAENLLNHYLFPSSADIYVVKDDIPKWKDKIVKKGLVGKGNFRLLVYDPHVLYKKQKIKGLWVASTPQVLLDLKREGGVCQEAYDIMVKKYVRAKRN